MTTMQKSTDKRAVATQDTMHTYTIEEACSAPRANITAWAWASDKICRNCYHYDGQYCNLDGKRYGENSYCSSWRP